MAPKITISIASYNTLGILRNCLQSVFNGQMSSAAEVIVVDNGSTDGTAQMVEQEFPKTILIRNLKNKGFAGAHNQAFTHSSGEYFMLLNSDTLVGVGAIDYLASFLDTHKDCGALGCRLVDAKGQLLGSVSREAGFFWIIGNTLGLKRLLPNDEFVRRHFGKLLNRLYPYYADHDIEKKVDAIDGAAMVIRRDAYISVGGLDQDFFFGSEDGQLCYDLRRKGWNLYFTPRVTIVHLLHQSRKRIGYKDLVYNTRNHILLLTKQRHIVLVPKVVMFICLCIRLVEAGFRRTLLQSPSLCIDEKGISEVNALCRAIYQTLKFRKRQMDSGS